MNYQNYPNPQILLRQDSFCGITWRGYLTRATLLAIGYGCYILLTNNKMDLSESGKRCFYVIREYFPHGKEGKGEGVEEGGDDKNAEEREALNKNRDFRPFAATEYKNDEATPNKLHLVNRKVSKNINNIEENEYKKQTCTTLHSYIFQYGSKAEEEEDGGGGGGGDSDKPNNSIPKKNYFISSITWLEDKRNDLKLSNNYLIITIIPIIVVTASIISAKFQLVQPNWLKFIGYGSIFDFLIPALIVISTIYIWFIYQNQNSSSTIRRE